MEYTLTTLHQMSLLRKDLYSQLSRPKYKKIIGDVAWKIVERSLTSFFWKGPCKTQKQWSDPENVLQVPIKMGGGTSDTLSRALGPCYSDLIERAVSQTHAQHCTHVYAHAPSLFLFLSLSVSLGHSIHLHKLEHTRARADIHTHKHTYIQTH